MITITELLSNLKNELFIKFLLIGHRLQYLGDRELKKDGLTTKQALAIIAIEKMFSSPPSISDVTDVLSTSRQNVKQIINQLVKKGFLTINQDEKDRRVLRIQSTEKNQQYWDKRAEDHVKFIQSVLDGLTDQEVRTLDQLINKLLNHIEKRYSEVK